MIDPDHFERLANAARVAQSEADAANAVAAKATNVARAARKALLDYCTQQSGVKHLWL